MLLSKRTRHDREHLRRDRFQRPCGLAPSVGDRAVKSGRIEVALRAEPFQQPGRRGDRSSFKKKNPGGLPCSYAREAALLPRVFSGLFVVCFHKASLKPERQRFKLMRNSALVLVFLSRWMSMSIESAAGTPCMARRNE